MTFREKRLQMVENTNLGLPVHMEGRPQDGWGDLQKGVGCWAGRFPLFSITGRFAPLPQRGQGAGCLLETLASRRAAGTGR